LDGADLAAEKWKLTCYTVTYKSGKKVIYPAHFDGYEFIVRTSNDPAIAQAQLLKARDAFFEQWSVLDARVCKMRKFVIVYETLLEMPTTVEIEALLARTATEQVKELATFKSLMSVKEI
jgi:hypothetical protein